MHHWKGNEPWKKKEPGARLNQKQLNSNRRAVKEQISMEEQTAQQVRVIFEKTKLWNMEHFHTVVISMRNPLSKKEFMERMQKAFPNLDLIEEGS